MKPYITYAFVSATLNVKSNKNPPPLPVSQPMNNPVGTSQLIYNSHTPHDEVVIVNCIHL